MTPIPASSRPVMHFALLVVALCTTCTHVLGQDAPAAIHGLYTLAPGDAIDLAVYGRPELARSGVRVAADGTVSALGLTDVPASGLSLDLLRDDLQRRLAPMLRHPLIEIRPAELTAHRYVILGKVVDRGSFPLDRPVTILEAVARARGLETGLQGGSTVEIADLDHSLLLRDGEALAIDFHALLIDGDLRWNLHLHPGDVLIFPSAMANQVNVLGAVVNPGQQAYADGLTLVPLLARRGGFLERAQRGRVLVVRGNLAAPTVQEIDVERILTGEDPDRRILPGDLVYVPDRPGEELRRLVRVAVTAFASILAGRAGREAFERSIK